MNSSPTILRFVSGSVTPASFVRNLLLGPDVHERHVEVTAERLDDLLCLVLAHQPVVDEDAGELVAHGLVDEECGNGRVDTTREATDDALGADLGTDPRDLLLDHGSRRPARRSARNLVEEVLQDLLAITGVDDLGMELHGVEAAVGILERRDRRRRRSGGDAGSWRRGDHGVAMAHPHDLLRREIVEERGLAELRVRLAVLGDVVRFDRSPEIASHQLHPVTDPERRNPELEDRRVELRCALGVHRRRATRENQRERDRGPDLCRRQPVADELRVHARLAHAPRDQLAVLPAEIEHEHRPLLGQRLRGRKRKDGSLRHAGSSERLC